MHSRGVPRQSIGSKKAIPEEGGENEDSAKDRKRPKTPRKKSYAPNKDLFAVKVPTTIANSKSENYQISKTNKENSIPQS